MIFTHRMGSANSHVSGPDKAVRSFHGSQYLHLLITGGIFIQPTEPVHWFPAIGIGSFAESLLRKSLVGANLSINRGDKPKEASWNLQLQNPSLLGVEMTR